VKEKTTGKVFAMKQVFKQFIINYRFQDQVRKEVEIMYTLNHPNIIKLYAHFEDHKYLYLIMELAEIGDLRQIIKKDKQKFSEKQIKAILRDTVLALQYMHSHVPQVIHRDIKPENILQNKDGVYKLADFGWSNVIIEENRTTTCGTPDYMPPEMFESDSHDERVDYWSLGVMAYELITGELPFRIDENDKKLMNENKLNKDEVLQNKIKELNYSFPPDFPKDAQDLVSKLLTRNPNDRLVGKEILKHPWF